MGIGRIGFLNKQPMIAHYPNADHKNTIPLLTKLFKIQSDWSREVCFRLSGSDLG